MSTDIFLGLSNNILGESQDAIHADKIDVQSWSWGMTQSGTTHEGSGGGGGKVAVQDILLTKFVDLATNDLIKKCTSGQFIETGELIVRKSGGEGGPIEYFKIIMEAIIISSYSTGGAASKPGGAGDTAADKITENLTLNFRYFEVYYTLQAGADAGAESMAGWDIGANEPWGA